MELFNDILGGSGGC